MMTQSWLLVEADMSCSSQHLPVRAFFSMTFVLIVSIAFGGQCLKLYKGLHCLFGFEYQQ